MDGQLRMLPAVLGLIFPTLRNTIIQGVGDCKSSVLMPHGDVNQDPEQQ